MQFNHEMMWKELKEKLYPRADSEGLLSVADLDEVMEELENEWQKLVNVKSVDMPKAFEPTAILNEVKADKGLILTEEELNSCYRLVGKGDTVGLCEFAEKFAIRVLDQASAYTSLLATNAELSFENMMRKRYEGFLKSIINNGETLNENDDFETFKAKINAWEDRP